MMMFGYGHGWPIWEAALMWAAMIAALGLLSWAVYAIAGNASRRGGSGTSQDGGGPSRILDKRLARGEIDTDEYTRLRDALARGRTHQPADAGNRN